jgi:hypothetical protein
MSLWATTEKASPIQVMVIDPLINPKSLETSTIHPQRSPKIKKVSTVHRDRLFETVGIKNYLTSYNELQKNNLYLSASSAPVDRLVQQYPLLPKDKLTALRIAILKNQTLE